MAQTSHPEEIYAILYTALKPKLFKNKEENQRIITAMFCIYLPTKIAKNMNSLSNDNVQTHTHVHNFKKKYYSLT